MLAPDGPTYYTYNSRNRMTSLKYRDGVINYFYYDATDRRYAIHDSDGTTYFTHDMDGLCALLERDVAGSVTAEHVRGYSPTGGIGDRAGARITAGGDTYFQYDTTGPTGNTHRITRPDNTIAAAFEYNAFGRLLRDELPPEGTKVGFSSPAYTRLKDDPDARHWLTMTRPYDTWIGRFLQRDPMGYQDGMNLYEYLGNKPLGRTDPTGTDFIAVADRKVKKTAGIFWHYAIMYWSSTESISKGGGELNHRKGYTAEEVSRLVCGGKLLKSVELLARTGWKVWGTRSTYNPFSSARVWGKKGVWISEIVFATKGTYRIMPVYEGGSSFDKTAVEAAWGRIRDAAKAYNWAEEQGFAAGPNFSNWPASMYKSWQTNSNTFVRHTIGATGLAMVEMTGSHPGHGAPSQNTDNDFWGLPWHFFAAHTPWFGSENEKPEPTDPAL